LDDRSVMSQLKSALTAGAVRGAIGHLNLDEVDVDNLEAAIHYAHHIGCKTQGASQLLATAQLVLRLRQALMVSDLDAARQMLEAVRGKVLAPCADEEVQTIKREVDNWLVISEISAAISNGAAKVRL
jgi:hypothetical protein